MSNSDAPILEEEVEEFAPQWPRLQPIAWEDLHRLPKREPLVVGLLDRNAMSMVFGSTGSGKSFFVLDLAASIALGRDWRGRKVRKGAVVYIATELQLGIHERLTAFRLHHDVDAEGVPLYVIPEPIDLNGSDDDVDLLLRGIAALPNEHPIELIVIDTLSRAMAGGNENSPDAMGAFVNRCDRLRRETGAHILVIHHPGKDERQGARGHSLLKAAIDSEIEITKGSVGKGITYGTARVTKQRDRCSDDVFGFGLKQLEVGKDSDGNPVTSCVVVTTDATSSSSGGTVFAGQPGIALSALTAVLEGHGIPAPVSANVPDRVKVITMKQWRDECYARKISDKTDAAKGAAFRRARDRLVQAGRVGIGDNFVWLIGTGQGDAHTNTP